MMADDRSERRSRVSPIESGVVVGMLLNQLKDVVRGLIREFESATKGILIQAGGEVFLAIQNFEVVYKDLLKDTFEEVNKTVQGTLENVRSVVMELEKGIAADVEKIIGDAQTVINALPFTDKHPQMARFSPTYVAPSLNAYEFTLMLKGNFPQAQDKDFTPYLVIGDRRYELIENTTQSLKFRIPISALTRGGSATSFGTIEAGIFIPYDLGLFHKKKVATYKAVIGVLPSSPGRIIFRHKEIKQFIETKSLSTPTFYQHSSDDDLIDIHYTADGPPAGWTVQPGSSNFVLEWAQGNQNEDWSYNWERDNPSVSYRVTTIHRSWGTSGKLNFHITYNTETQREEIQWIDEVLDLRWGDSRTFEYSPGYWKVLFDSFDGKHNEISGSEVLPFLIVRSGPVTTQVAVPSASEVSWPQQLAQNTRQQEYEFASP